jgi:hypothetical protein
LTQITPQSKQNISYPKSKENCIDLESVSSPVKELKSGQFGGIPQKGSPDSVWTLKNVGN